MRRIAAAVVLLSLGATGVMARGMGQQEEPTSPVAINATGRDSVEFLPVTGVTLFTSGVGYFQHDGYVDGSAEVTLSFDVDDINDLLKSLVLQDFDGGHVEAVTYPSQDPLSRILESFSLNVADNPTVAQILSRARGEQVVINARRTVTGIIAGIESQTEIEDGVAVQVQLLNIIAGIAP